MKTPFSRRQLMQGAGALAGLSAATRLSGGALIGKAFAQTTPEKSAVLVVFLNGGYNAVFSSADSFRAAGTFGVTGDNLMRGINNAQGQPSGLVIDAPTLGTLDAYSLSHLAAVGIRHGITAHGPAQTAGFSDGSRSYALQLANAMGGTAAIKAVQLGNRGLPGPKPAENGVSLQVITDMRTTIAALGGANDPTIPDRAIAANGLVAAQTMSAARVASSPQQLVTLTDGYAAGIETLRKPVQPFNYNTLAQAYGVATTTTAVTDFKTQIVAAELMITAGANVVCAVDPGWDTHGDRTAANVRSMMNQRILPPLKTFLTRMLNRPDYNVTVAIFGDFARSLPGSDHASALTATVIGKYVKPGTTGKVSANVQLPVGSPAAAGFWSYLGTLARAPSTPFGPNPHGAITAVANT